MNEKKLIVMKVFLLWSCSSASFFSLTQLRLLSGYFSNHSAGNTGSKLLIDYSFKLLAFIIKKINNFSLK